MEAGMKAILEVTQRMDTTYFESARALHDEMELRLRNRGFTVVREYPVPDRGDGRRGQIDLVVLEPFRMALELDTVNPRSKSVIKLKTFSGERYVFLRASRRIIGV
ncbi:MAG: hypothetical protein WBE13_13760 [Candidatus Acidiferrum sp.]